MLRREGYQVFSLGEQVPDGPVGKIVEASYLAMAEEYRIQLAKNVRRGMLYLVRQHHAFYGPPPIGYRRKPVSIGRHRDGREHFVNQLEPDPLKAPAVQRAFEMAAGGASLAEINHEAGFYADPGGMSRMLRNPIYTGIYQREGEVILDFCEPLIDAALFARVQTARKDAATRQGWHHPRAERSPFLLGGMIYCGNCGKNLIGHRNGRWGYYHCANIVSRVPNPTCSSGGIPAAAIENDVLDQIKRILERPKMVIDLYAEASQADDRTAAHSARVERLQSDLKGIDRLLDNATRLLVQHPESEALNAEMDRLETERGKTRLALYEAAANPPGPTLSAGSLEAMIVDLRERIESGNKRSRQLALRALNTQVTARRVPGKSRLDMRYAGKVVFVLGIGFEFPIGDHKDIDAISA
jgi:hypothetical protein